MTKIVLECLYCGNKWEHVYYGGSLSVDRCSKCGDKNIKATRKEDDKIDTYGDKVGPNNNGKGDGWNKW